MKASCFYLQVKRGQLDAVVRALPPKSRLLGRGDTTEADPTASWVSLRWPGSATVEDVRRWLSAAAVSDHVVRVDLLPKPGDGVVYAKQRILPLTV